MRKYMAEKKSKPVAAAKSKTKKGKSAKRT
jgi:hypothetical protein